jgi:hypothetical protein
MAITWTEGSPGDRSDLSGGAQAIRDLKVAVSDGVQPSMYWPPESSLASAGEMKHGSFRMTVPVLASVLSVGIDPRLLIVTSDTSRLYSQGASTLSLQFGGVQGLDHGTLPALTSRWAMDGGASDSSSVVTFTNPYLGLPFVGFSDYYGGVGTVPYVCVVHSLTSTTFRASLHSASGNTFTQGEAGGSMVWMSLGTASF